MKISIVTVTYNSDRTLEETFQSVLIQEYRPLQYIIIDGGSIDHTLDIIQAYKEKFEKAGIEFFYISEPDNGISDAFNKGIANADGDIIGIINSDDKLYKNALSILAEEYDLEVGIYYGNCVIINDDHSHEYLAVPKKDLSLIERFMPLFHPSTFIKKGVYEQYGGYDLELKYCMDRELLFRMYRDNVKFKYIAKPLAYYREGGANQSNYDKCVAENTKISIDYGMRPIKAYIIRRYRNFHDWLWRMIQKSGLERIFHRKIN